VRIRIQLFTSGPESKVLVRVIIELLTNIILILESVSIFDFTSYHRDPEQSVPLNFCIQSILKFCIQNMISYAAKLFKFGMKFLRWMIFHFLTLSSSGAVADISGVLCSSPVGYHEQQHEQSSMSTSKNFSKRDISRLLRDARKRYKATTRTTSHLRKKGVSQRSSRGNKMKPVIGNARRDIDNIVERNFMKVNGRRSEFSSDEDGSVTPSDSDNSLCNVEQNSQDDSDDPNKMDIDHADVFNDGQIDKSTQHCRTLQKAHESDETHGDLHGEQIQKLTKCMETQTDLNKINALKYEEKKNSAVSSKNLYGNEYFSRLEIGRKRALMANNSSAGKVKKVALEDSAN